MKQKKQTVIFLMALIVLASCKNEPQTATTTEKVEKVAWYDEAHRPQLHFTPQTKWMNDPNGMVYFEGEYHLFYQYYPDGTVWGPMHWGHAVSKDLVRWEHLPIALEPDDLGYIFSGSAVIDWNNTTGFQKGNTPPMVAIYTNHLMEGEKAGRHNFQTQSIAYSLDKGRTWKKYEKNPVIPNTENIHDFRDPKVFWHESSKHWVMILAANDKVKLYHSQDLKTWTFSSDFGLGEGSQARPWECPDLFELKTEKGESKWVMLVSVGNREAIQAPNGGTGTQYFIGDFDGKTFKNNNPAAATLWLDGGRDNYAGVTFSDVPKADGRRLFIGWMSNWDYATVVPTDSWRSAMTLARTLTLKKTNEGYRVFANPVKELETLRGKKSTLEKGTLAATQLIDLEFQPSVSEAIFEFNTETATHPFGVKMANTKGEYLLVLFDKKLNGFMIDRTGAGKGDFHPNFRGTHTVVREQQDSNVKMHLVFDKSSVELFADDGRSVMTDIFFPNEDFTEMHLYIENGSVEFKGGVVHELKSIWK
jgi:fructan beta-fructosidase